MRRTTLLLALCACALLAPPRRPQEAPGRPPAARPLTTLTLVLRGSLLLMPLAVMTAWRPPAARRPLSLALTLWGLLLLMPLAATPVLREFLMLTPLPVAAA